MFKYEILRIVQTKSKQFKTHYKVTFYRQGEDPSLAGVNDQTEIMFAEAEGKHFEVGDVYELIKVPNA